MQLKLARSLIASAAYIFILLAVYTLHINYLKVNVVFYAAIMDAVWAAAIACGLLMAMRFFQPLGVFEKLQLIVIWLIAGYAVAISVPTVIDRSLSFYILEKIQQRGGGIRQDAFERVFTQEYMKEHRIVDVRLTEQLESGTIVIENNCVLLTPKGWKIAAWSRNFRQHWLPKKRLLMGVYSDALTDPFRSSAAVETYTCQR